MKIADVIDGIYQELFPEMSELPTCRFQRSNLSGRLVYELLSGL